MKFQIDKGITLILFALLFFSRMNAQKPVIDSSVFGKWRNMGPTQSTISNDGNYVFYVQVNDLFLSSTDNHWKKEFKNIGGKSAIFTQDGSKAVFQRNDSVFVVSLGKEDISYISAIDGKADVLPYGTDDLLIYKLKTNADQLLIKTLSGGVQHSFPVAEKYWFNQREGIILLLIKEQSDSNLSYYLKSVSLKDNVITNIWQGGKIDNLVFNTEGSSYSFLSRDSKGDAAIWCASLATQSPVLLVHDHDDAIETGFKIVNIIAFDKSSDKIYFSLTEAVLKKINPVTGVDVYDYKDPTIQSEQLYKVYKQGIFGGNYTAIINIRDKTVIKIEGSNAMTSDSRYYNQYHDNWVLVHECDKRQNIFWGNGFALENEWNWNKKALTSLYLLSLKDGSKRYLLKNVPLFQPRSYYLSPNEEYVIFYDPDKIAYYSYEIATGSTKPITEGMSSQLTNLKTYDYPVVSGGRKYSPNGIAGFIDDGKYILLNGQFDIYKVDITGKEKPVNLTSGYGQAHHIVLRVDYSQPRPLFKSGEKILLSAFNIDTKENGFYNIELEPSGKPDSLTLQPERFGSFTSYSNYAKAKNAGAYLVIQSDEKSFPNVYFSKDLKKFTAISDIHPEKNYNWLTAELVHYKLPDGRPCLGILYKPENFDPQKKYPLIIHYYERLSDNLHVFELPDACTGEINIPYYVSNGYLVFTPDIHYTVGSPGRSALNSIVSAAQFLSKRSYVNAKKIGIQGMSFGGFETNYVVSHSNLFAAAMSTSGMTDFVSIYGSIIGDGTPRQRQYEIEHDRMGGSLWDMPDKYIENSPVLRADKITTPLLMVANDLDPDVPHYQGIELFTALRRLQKKAWMLQYDGEHHGIGGNEAKNDFTIRMFQFFNHYLKDAPPPIWMTEGVPAAEKGLFTGLEFDHSGNKP